MGESACLFSGLRTSDFCLKPRDDLVDTPTLDLSGLNSPHMPNQQMNGSINVLSQRVSGTTA